jgi:two-component system chemotaxis response regulator CheY
MKQIRSSGVKRSADLPKARRPLMDSSLPVLVVDDFKTMGAIVCRLMREVGFVDVDQVTDGPAALAQLRKRKYGLIVSDWDMRPMNGTELIREIRNDPMHETTPIIMITAMADTGGSWRSGADGYLTKPFKVPDLRAKIEEITARKTEKMPAG